jgi:hypothetical protein
MPIIRSSRLYWWLQHLAHTALWVGCGAAAPHQTTWPSLNKVLCATCCNHLYSLELLMMGIKVPETCWADYKVSKSLCNIWLAFFSTYYKWLFIIDCAICWIKVTWTHWTECGLHFIGLQTVLLLGSAVTNLHYSWYWCTLVSCQSSSCIAGTRSEQGRCSMSDVRTVGMFSRIAIYPLGLKDQSKLYINLFVALVWKGQTQWWGS